MTEYVYTKGIGWHISRAVILRLKNCTVRLEVRIPMPGERYLSFYVHDSYWLKPDGSMNFDLMIQSWQDKHYLEDFALYRYPMDPPDDTKTLVLVEL